MLLYIAPYLPGFEHALSPARQTLSQLSRAVRCWAHGVPYTRTPIAPWTWGRTTFHESWETPKKLAAEIADSLDVWFFARGYVKTLRPLWPDGPAAVHYDARGRVKPALAFRRRRLSSSLFVVQSFRACTRLLPVTFGR